MTEKPFIFITEKKFVLISGIIFSVVAMLQLARILLGWSLIIAGWPVPIVISAIAVVVAGALGYHGLQFATRK